MGKNWSWSYQRGRELRLDHEAKALMECKEAEPLAIPLHSYDATMQAYFEQGWHSVRPAEAFREAMTRKGLLKPKGDDHGTTHHSTRTG